MIEIENIGPSVSASNNRVRFAKARVDGERRDIIVKHFPGGGLRTVNMEREVQALEQNRHEGIVKLLGYDLSKRDIYLAPAQGVDISYLRSTSPSAEMSLLLNIAKAISHMHSNGAKPAYAHHDLHPGNIRSTANGVVTLLDLGHAFPVHDPPKDFGCVVVGCPPYIAPEKWLGECEDARAGDVFSFGAIVYQKIAKRPAINAWDNDYFRASRKYQAPHLNSRIPILDDLIDACLCRSPGDRPTSEELVYGLENV